MKILILGTGYLGSEIAFSLSQNHSVTCIDHGNNFSEISSSLKNVKLIEGDIKDTTLIKNVSKDIDLICYCIETGGVIDCIEKPDHYKKINVDDFKQLLKSITNPNCSFLLLSSTFVYSDVEKNFEETLTDPKTIYGQLRLEQESILMQSNLSYTILRMSNIYGHQNFYMTKFDNVIDKFIANIFHNHEIFLYGDGTQLVDFVHIDNFLNIFNQIINKKFKNEIYNISNEFRISISDIANNMKNIAKNQYNISVLLKKQFTNDKLPNIPYVSSSKIQKNFLWKNSQNMNSKLKFMFETLKNS